MIGVRELVDQVVERRDCAARDRRVFTELDPLGGGPARRDHPDLLVEEVRVGDALAQRGVAGVTDEMRGVVGEDRVVVGRRVRQDAHPAVRGPVRSPVRSEQALIARLSGARVKDGFRSVLDQHERLHRVEHGDLDVFASTGALPIRERRGDGVHDGRPGASRS
ncbi:MAG: hypothetical protein QM733_19870 [Ilumatobacteraceae bacterium]